MSEENIDNLPMIPQQRTDSWLILQGQNPQSAVYNEYLEAETAWAVGFNAQGLSEEEENLLPPGADEAAYVQVGHTVKPQLTSVIRERRNTLCSSRLHRLRSLPTLGKLRHEGWQSDLLLVIPQTVGGDVAALKRSRTQRPLNFVSCGVTGSQLCAHTLAAGCLQVSHLHVLLPQCIGSACCQPTAAPCMHLSPDCVGVSCA